MASESPGNGGTLGDRLALAPSCRPRLDAKAGLWQAQEIFRRIGAAETAEVAAELDVLTKTRPAPDLWQACSTAG
jgi:hypothetical protein